MSLDLSSLQGVATTQSSSGAAKTKDSDATLDQNQFLQLMIAQMKNQDPTKPMDPTTFMSQLAQFSTVTGIESMNKSISGLSESLLSSQVLSGTSLVGHDVLAQGSTGTLATGGTIDGAVDVPPGAKMLKVNVLDAGGQLVRTITLQPTEGRIEFSWDGQTNAGTPAAPGSYDFEILAGDGKDTIQLDSLLSSHVNSVTIDSSTHELSLNTNNGTLPLSSVRRIK
jgi:flagellar basal-body rod modification protein FlgD